MREKLDSNFGLKEFVIPSEAGDLQFEGRAFTCAGEFKS